MGKFLGDASSLPATTTPRHANVPQTHAHTLRTPPPQVCVLTGPVFSAFCALATYGFMKEVLQPYRIVPYCIRTIPHPCMCRCVLHTYRPLRPSLRTTQ